MVPFSWNEQEQIRLVQSDYDKTLEFMRHGLRTMFQLRAVAIALTLALIGFAVQRNLAALAIVAAVFTVVFFAADWYQARQYSEAAHHLRASKTTAAAYYRVLSEAGEPRPRREFTQLLADHELGLAPEVKGSRTVYVSLLAVATASALAVGLLHAGKQPAKIEQPNQEQVDKVSIEALTSEIRAQLSQLAARLQQSARPADQHLGTEIARDVAAGGSLLVAGGGLLAAVKLAGTAPEAIAGKVLGDITGELFKSTTFNSTHTTGGSFTFSPDFGTGLSLTGAPSFTFNSSTQQTNQQAATGCIAFLVELDSLVDDDPGVTNLLPKHEFPLDKRNPCGLLRPLTDKSPLVRALAKH